MTPKLRKMWPHLKSWACWTSTRAWWVRSRKCPSYPSPCQTLHIRLASSATHSSAPFLSCTSTPFYQPFSFLARPRPFLPDQSSPLFSVQSSSNHWRGPPTLLPHPSPCLRVPPTPSQLPSLPHLSIKHQPCFSNKGFFCFAPLLFPPFPHSHYKTTLLRMDMPCQSIKDHLFCTLCPLKTGKQNIPSQKFLETDW